MKICNGPNQNLAKKGMRHPGIEPGPTRWQRAIVPFNQRRWELDFLYGEWLFSYSLHNAVSNSVLMMYEIMDYDPVTHWRRLQLACSLTCSNAEARSDYSEIEGKKRETCPGRLSRPSASFWRKICDNSAKRTLGRRDNEWDRVWLDLCWD